MTPRAYLDQNMLITCAGDPARRDHLIEIHQQRAVEMVLSPWHLYEIGKGEPDEIETVVRALEMIEPAWLLDRADLLTFEFAQAWTRFWRREDLEFEPIGSLDYILQAMHPQSENTYAIGEAVKLFHDNGGRERIKGMLDAHRLLSRENREQIKQGRGKPGSEKRTAFRFACNHLARMKGYPLSHPQFEQVSGRIASHPLTSEMIRFFLEFGGRDPLKAYRIEWELTHQLYRSDAELNRNRFIDRQHAVVALAFCDFLVTDDEDLQKRCAAIQPILPFRTAVVLGEAAFFERFGLPSIRASLPSSALASVAPTETATPSR
jgi:hypothetical protein